MNHHLILLLILPILASATILSEKTVGPFVLTTGETLQLHLNEYFSGFNISYEFNKTDGVEIINGVITQSKGASPIKDPITKSYAPRDVNEDLTGFLYQLANTTVHLSSLDNISAVPSFINSTTLDATHCFDLLEIAPNHLLVDCYKVIDASNVYNSFVIMADGSTSSIPSMVITGEIAASRQIKIITSAKGFEYLIRSNHFTSNTSEDYVEVFRMVNGNIVLLDVLDHLYFNVQSLNIDDFDALNDSFFVLDSHVKTVYKIQLDVASVYVKTTFQLTSVYNRLMASLQDDMYVVAVGGPSNALQIDFTTTPRIIKNFVLPGIANSTLEQLAFTEYYMVVKISGPLSNNSTGKDWIVVFENDKRLFSTVYTAFQYDGYGNPSILVNPNFDIVMLLGTTNVNFLINDPILKIAPKQVTAAKVPLTFVAKSMNFGTNDTINVNTTMFVADPASTQVFQLDTIQSFKMGSPGEMAYPLSDLFTGPALEFEVTMTLKNNTTPVQKPEEKPVVPVKNVTNKTDALADFFFQMASFLSSPQESFLSFAETNSTSNSSSSSNSTDSNKTKPDSNSTKNSTDNKNGTKPDPIKPINPIQNSTNTSNYTATVNKIMTSNISVEIMTKLNITNSTEILSIQSITTPNSDFYIIIQKTDKKMVIYNYYSQTFQTIALTEVVQTTALYLDKDVLNVGILTVNGSVYIWKTLDNSLNAIVITKTPIDVISDIAFGQNMMFIVQPISKAILVYKVSDLSYFTAIDDSVMKSLNINYFSPLACTNSIFHPSLIFIADKESVIVVSVANILTNHFELKTQIKSNATRQLGLNGFKIALSQSSLVILAGNPDIIEEYSLSNYNYVYLRKVYPLYGYKLVMTEGSFDFSGNDAHFYIQATKANLNYIMIYSSGYTANNVLYGIIPITLAANETIKRVTSSGVVDDIVFVVKSVNVESYSIIGRPSLNIKINSLDKSLYDIVLRVKSALTDNTTALSNSFAVSTYEVDVQVTTKNSTIPNNLLTFSKAGDIKFNPNEFFQGPVLEYNISCKDCGTKIKLQNRLDKTDGLFNGTAGGFSAGGEYVIMHIESAVLLYNRSMVLKKRVGLGKPGLTCTASAVHDSGNYLISACFNKNNVNILVVTSLVSVDPFPIAYMNIPSINNIDKILMFNNMALLMDSPTDKLNTESQIIVIRINVDSTNLDDEFVTFKRTITASDMNLNQLLMTDVEIHSTQNFTYLILTEAKYGIYAIRLADTDYVIDTPFRLLNLRDEITQDGAPLDAKFAGLSVIKEVETNSSKVLTVIFTTTNFHGYQIDIEIKDGALVQNATFTKRFLKFGDYNALAGLESSETFLVFPAYNPMNLTLSRRMMLYTFDQPASNNSNSTNSSKPVDPVKPDDKNNTNNSNSTNNTNSSSNSNSTNASNNTNSTNKTSSFKLLQLDAVTDDKMTNYELQGSYKFVNTPGEFKMFQLANGSTKALRFNPDTNQVELFRVSKNVTIEIVDTNGLDDNDVKLSAMNGYTTSSVSIPMHNDANSDSDSGSKLWIYLLVIAIVLVLILGFVAFKKFRKSKKEAPLLENAA